MAAGGLDRVLIEKTRPPVKFVDGVVGGTGRASADKDRPSAPAWAVQLPTLGMSLDQAVCFATNPRALLVRIPANQQMGRAGDPSMARSAHGTVRGRRLRLAEGADPIATLHRPKGGVTWPACDVCC
jgi:hypothetical protein